MLTTDELVKAEAHFDASVHVGGHPGQDWPEHAAGEPTLRTDRGQANRGCGQRGERSFSWHVDHFLPQIRPRVTTLT